MVMRRDFPYVLLLAFVVGIAGCVDTKVTTNDTVQFSVPDMMCEESCGKAVHDTLAAQPGAVEVSVDFPQRLVTVAVEKEKFDSQAALAALLDKQFSKARLVGAEEPVPPAEETTGETAAK
jgi:copper chaperone CopZ